MYIDEISKSVEKINEADILDHAIAKLLPIVTSLRNNMAGSRDNEDDSVDVQTFDITEVFAPSQKNEKQLSFHKVKTPGRRKSKLPFK